ncbi:kinase-like domain-containing protein [Aspergillus pseudotamarii]|uniref:non-specific serine/threonine protein kinase n=1 Tax=Aspergillus pseudotamarii TaxID=132259 RepID=A0A5N6SRJ3_ASPPS|nr:kinase-like domain-containing protein [Aspergillus pseudotamarii]KAE8137308.1 kinase-like domain-containing protein [Aspergillus pseudotamarii]
MSRMLRALRIPLFRRLPSPARQFPPGPLLDSTDKVEEEKLAWYSHYNFFPVKISDVFQSKYQVVGKLGYGGYSTVWLCRDLEEHVYVTLKLYECNSAHAKREIQVYDHLKSLKSCHTGTVLVRTVLDKFQLSSTDGSHFYQCLIHPPLGMSLYELRNRCPRKVFPENLLKPTLIHILLALDFLHTEAHVIHTDIQEKNIMLNIEDESILVDFEEAEISNPSPRKVVGDRAIYHSRKLGIPKKHGRPVLSDFGEARFGSESGTYCDDVQPFMYRAPEVLLRMPWNEKIDIWNLAVVAWDLFEQGHLFYAQDENKRESDSHHLAEMIAYLGPPPRDMLEKSEYANKYFDSSGKWKCLAEIPLTSLEGIESNLRAEQQEDFLRFIRKMLQWRPEDRPTANELLSDSWLRST